MFVIILYPYPNSRFREVGPHGDLLARGHVWVAVPCEGGFEFLQLLAGEMRSLAALSLVFLVALVVHRRLVGPDPRSR